PASSSTTCTCKRAVGESSTTRMVGAPVPMRVLSSDCRGPEAPSTRRKKCGSSPARSAEWGSAGGGARSQVIAAHDGDPLGTHSPSQPPPLGGPSGGGAGASSPDALAARHVHVVEESLVI